MPVSLRQRVENNSLIVENVQRDSDQGSYTCIARNKQGHNSQGTVSVQVVGKCLKNCLWVRGLLKKNSVGMACDCECMGRST